MIASPSSGQNNKGLFHTGIFLRPRIATSLQALIRNKTIQDRAKFTVAKSQIHPNGLCEIVVKRQDPTVSTNAIMELLERCRKLVEEHILPETKGIGTDLNSTIDISDNDDSIYIISPSTSGGRKISFKRTLSIDSPVSSKKLSGIEPLNKKQNLIINVNSQPSLSNQDRKVVLESKDLVSAQHHASIKGDNIVIKVPNNSAPSTSQCDDADSSVMILDVYDDAKPSAPTWTTSLGSSFPLNSISQNLGKNLAKDVLPITPENQPSFNGVSNQEKVTSKPDICNPGNDLIRRFSEVIKENCKPNVFTSVKPAENFGKSRDQLNGNSSGITNQSQNEEERQCGVLTKISNVNPNNIEAKIKGGELEQVIRVDHQTARSSPNSIPTQDVVAKQSENGVLAKISKVLDPNIKAQMKGGELEQVIRESSTNSVPTQTMLAKQPEKEMINCQMSGSGADRASSSESGELSSDDEIIIEKELKSTNKPLSLIIEDSDDDIAVCEVVNTTKIVNEPMLSKRQRRKLKKINKHIGPGTSSGPDPDYIQLGSSQQRMRHQTSNQPQNKNIPSVASTSSGPPLDYIPLFNSSQHRKRPLSHSPNQHQNLNKASKFQKIQDKKLKKAKALGKSSNIQSGKVDSCSEQKQSSSSLNKEKREFGGNIFNPNPEQPKTGLRPVVIDASNVAIGHGRGPFSVRGLQICIKYFTDRGHKVFAFAPKYRRFHVSPEDRKAMDELETQGILSFTPSRTMEDGRKVASYDDRYIVQVAAELGGVIISTDNFRDLLSENEAWRETIEQRLLMFTWVGDMILFPNDPLGRKGPHLQDFLRFPDSADKK